MFRELQCELASRKLEDPRDRKFRTDKKMLKQFMNGEIWADLKQQRESGRKGVQCSVSGRHLESVEEYEEHLDRLFRRELLQKKNPR